MIIIHLLVIRAKFIFYANDLKRPAGRFFLDYNIIIVKNSIILAFEAIMLDLTQENILGFLF